MSNILKTVGNVLTSKDGTGHYMVRGFDTDGNALLSTGYNPIMAMLAPDESFEKLGTVLAPFDKETLPEDKVHVVEGDKSDRFAIGNVLEADVNDAGESGIKGTVRGVTQGGSILLQPYGVDQLRDMIGNEFNLYKSASPSEADSYTLDEEGTAELEASRLEYIAKGDIIPVL